MQSGFRTSRSRHNRHSFVSTWFVYCGVRSVVFHVWNALGGVCALPSIVRSFPLFQVRRARAGHHRAYEHFAMTRLKQSRSRVLCLETDVCFFRTHTPAARRRANVHATPTTTKTTARETRNRRNITLCTHSTSVFYKYGDRRWIKFAWARFTSVDIRHIAGRRRSKARPRASTLPTTLYFISPFPFPSNSEQPRRKFHWDRRKSLFLIKFREYTN